jgi:hypothetical protein
MLDFYPLGPGIGRPPSKSASGVAIKPLLYTPPCWPVSILTIIRWYINIYHQRQLTKPMVTQSATPITAAPSEARSSILWIISVVSGIQNIQSPDSWPLQDSCPIANRSSRSTVSQVRMMSTEVQRILHFLALTPRCLWAGPNLLLRLLHCPSFPSTPPLFLSGYLPFVSPTNTQNWWPTHSQ